MVLAMVRCAVLCKDEKSKVVEDSVHGKVVKKKEHIHALHVPFFPLLASFYGSTARRR